MSDDEAFIRAIVANPGDDAPRLIYADWLEERGDSRGAYVRKEVAAFRHLPDSLARSKAVEDLANSEAQADPIWSARITRVPAGICCDHIQFVESGRELDHHDVTLLKSRLGELPSQYIAFLLNYNGGYPRSRKFRSDIDFLSAEGCNDLQGFCRFDSKRADLSTVRRFIIAVNEPRLSEAADFFAIANLFSENEYALLGAEGERFGRVFRYRYVDHETNQLSGLVEWHQSLGMLLASLRIVRAGVKGYASTIE